MQHTDMDAGAAFPNPGSPFAAPRPATSGLRDLVPHALRAPLSRALGVAMLLFTAFAAGAFITWDATDPNMNHAVAGEPTNLLGWWGASLADMGLQLFGLAAPAALLAPLVWGWHLARGRRVGRGWARTGLAFAATVALAAALGAIAPPEGWPLTTLGLGGVTGDAVLASPKAFTGAYPSGFLGWIMACLFAFPAVWLAVLALRLPRAPKVADVPFDDRTHNEWSDWEEPRAGMASRLSASLAAPLGMASHIGLAARASFSRLVRARMPRRSRTVDQPATATEPTFADPASAHDFAPAAGEFAPVAAVEPASNLAAAMARAADAEPMADPTGAPAAFSADDFAAADEGWRSLEQGWEQAKRVEPEVTRPTRGPAARIHAAHTAEPEPSLEEPQRVNRYASGASGITAHRLSPEEAAPVVATAPAAPVAPAPAATNAPAATTTAPTAANTTAPPAHTVRRAAPQPGAFELPGTELLAEARNIVQDASLSQEALEDNARNLESVLADFGVKGHIIKVNPGPVVTLYELEPAPGIKSSRVIGLAEDIARSMEAIAARVAVIPGRNAIGIELPNKRRETVYLSEQLKARTFAESKAKLAMALGKTIGGEPVVTDLAKMPHLLVAGTTGSGKSVAINTMILSLLYKHTPEACRLIMIDPKMVELSVYDGIPHLLTPVVTDPKKAVVALKWTVREMEQRYQKMSKVGVRNVDGFNQRVREAARRGEAITRTVQTGFDRETGEALYEHEEFDLEPMPYIVVIIDEVADLMMVAGKDIEGAVQRLAQMARAAGIHVVMATQRPSTDVITGTIKANFPTRISFQVTSKIDSRVMLGEAGAEQLLGMGDMLHMAGGGRIERVHGPFVSDEEVEGIVGHLKLQGVPDYLDAITQDDEEDEAAEAGGSAGGGGAAGDMGESDDPYDQAVAVVLRDRKVSTSYIQRRLGIGYNRAASLIERMEQEGVIGPANHAGKREILVPAEDETI